ARALQHGVVDLGGHAAALRDGADPVAQARRDVFGDARPVHLCKVEARKSRAELLQAIRITVMAAEERQLMLSPPVGVGLKADRVARCLLEPGRHTDSANHFCVIELLGTQAILTRTLLCRPLARDAG